MNEAIEEVKVTVRNKLGDAYADPVLDALGRLKGRNLRSKIQARFQVLPRALQAKLPEMEMVIGCCVQARNYFVHGTKPRKLSIDALEESRSFLTETLEFIFVISELCECGWSYKAWRSRAGRGKFKEYLEGYDYSVKELKNAFRGGRLVPQQTFAE